MPKAQGEAARARQDRAGGFGGVKRRKVGSSMRRCGNQKPSVPRELLDGARDFRFPDSRATAGQVAALRSCLVDYLRGLPMGLYPSLGAETLAEATGLSAPTVRKRVAAGLPGTQDQAEASLTAEVLLRMSRGEFAGPLGYSPTTDVRELFRIMEFQPGGGFRPHADRLSRKHGVDLWQLYCAFRIDCLALHNLPPG